MTIQRRVESRTCFAVLRLYVALLEQLGIVELGSWINPSSKGVIKGGGSILN